MIRERLEALLRQDPDALLARDRREFDRRLAAAGGGLVLFGSGRLGRRALAGLRVAGVAVRAFVDNAPRTWEEPVDGVEVLPPQEAAARFAGRALFVVTVYTSGPVRRQLDDMGLPNAPFALLARRYAETLLPHAALDLPHAVFREKDDVLRAADVWNDGESREEYAAQVLYRLSPDPEKVPQHLPQETIYFPAGLFRLREDETFVDCGAYDGDSLGAFLRAAPGFRGRALLLEPDAESRARLERRVEALPSGIRAGVRVIPFAVGAKRGFVSFDATGTAASSVGSGEGAVAVAPLDELLQGERPSFVKMDVEGAEEDALAGARQTLAAHAPLLAICLYHRVSDLWRIPNTLAACGARYRLSLRRHADECWEEVCYAVPPGREA